MEEFEKLEQACTNVVEYLKEKHPHCYVVVSQDGIKLVETTIGIPFSRAED